LTSKFSENTLGKKGERKEQYLQPTTQIERAGDRQLLCEDSREKKEGKRKRNNLFLQPTVQIERASEWHLLNMDA